MHTIFENHFKDFCDTYEEQYAEKYGRFHLDRIVSVADHFIKNDLINEDFARNLLPWRNSGFSIDNSVQILTDKTRNNLSEYFSRALVSLKKLHYEPFKGRVLFHTHYNKYFGENNISHFRRLFFVNTHFG